jgi:hypothetical protein
MIMRIERQRFSDDMARMHVEIDNINDFLVGFCFIRNLDSCMKERKDKNDMLIDNRFSKHVGKWLINMFLVDIRI